ncbi:hypothetical protein [Nocardia brasiliensis]
MVVLTGDASAEQTKAVIEAFREHDKGAGALLVVPGTEGARAEYRAE